VWLALRLVVIRSEREPALARWAAPKEGAGVKAAEWNERERERNGCIGEITCEYESGCGCG